MVHLDLNQIFIATFGGYVKLFMHNFTYDVFRRLEIKSIHLTDFTGNLYTKMNSMLKQIIYEDRLMLFWLFSQIILIFSRAIQVIGLYNLLFSKNCFLMFKIIYVMTSTYTVKRINNIFSNITIIKVFDSVFSN